MPHSLRVRLSALRYKKIISDKDYDRLCKALDNENVLDKIRAEIEHLPFTMFNKKDVLDRQEVIGIINKHIGESE